MSKHENMVDINPEEVKKAVLEKMSVTEMAVMLLPHAKNRNNALKTFKYWLKQEHMPKDKYDEMLVRLAEAPPRDKRRARDTMLDVKDPANISPNPYVAIAMLTVRYCADDYVDAVKKIKACTERLDGAEGLVKTKLQREIRESKKIMRECEEFILSDRFDLFMPHVRGRDFMRMLKEKAKC